MVQCAESPSENELASIQNICPRQAHTREAEGSDRPGGEYGATEPHQSDSGRDPEQGKAGAQLEPRSEAIISYQFACATVEPYTAFSAAGSSSHRTRTAP
jgi:hypothetical protein